MRRARQGARSEYAPKFFSELYRSLQRVKAAFDPHNQLNPSKIATPLAMGAATQYESITLVDPGQLAIDGVPTRG